MFMEGVEQLWWRHAYDRRLHIHLALASLAMVRRSLLPGAAACSSVGYGVPAHPVCCDRKNFTHAAFVGTKENWLNPATCWQQVGR